MSSVFSQNVTEQTGQLDGNMFGYTHWHRITTVEIDLYPTPVPPAVFYDSGVAVLPLTRRDHHTLTCTTSQARASITE